LTKQERTPDRLRAGTLPDAGGVEYLVEHASDLAVLIDADCRVRGISVNPDCPSLGCLDHWVGRDLNAFLTLESREKLRLRLAEMRVEPGSRPRPLELNHADNATWDFPIRYSLHRVDGGPDVLLLGRDMQPIAEVQQRLLKEQMARERDLQQLRGERTFYRVVLEASETPLVLVEPEKGRIRDLNAAAATLLGTKVEALAGNAFAQAFEGRRRGELMEALQAAATAEDAAGVEVISRRNGAVLSLCPDYFRAAGELYLLVRLVSIDEGDRAGAEVAQSLATLFASAPDGIVLTDSKGVIREANEAFLVMVDAAQLRDVRDRSFGDLLSRGTVDLKLILDAALQKNRLRSYSAQMISVVGTRMSVDISVSRLVYRGGELGFGLIIRDVTPDDQPAEMSGAVAVSDDAMRNVMDLVGTASLKELVTATSDVIEKLCIETAVQLTGNNRVAAAEMLGLSRQSLYVKLRKHGLLNSEPDG